MSAIKYIGRTTNFYGHTLWEIVGNLRNYGIGRIIIRKTFQRYPEPCYYRILQVQQVEAPKEEHEYRKVRVTVEKTWRGITYPKPLVIYSTSYKPDYELVPKNEEAKYLDNTQKIQEKILPNKIDLPPLLKEYVKAETGVENPMMKVHFRKTDNRFFRLAAENEKPTVDFTINLGKPTSTKLYEGVL